MLHSAIIVFREALEAALVITIILAATKGLPGRHRWISAGVGLGVLGAMVVAFFAEAISMMFEGAGQELFNACVLFTAVLMLAWHNIWMSKHAKELVAHLKDIGSQVTDGGMPLYFISVAVGMAVLREGSEIVLFVYSLAASGDNMMSILTGGVLGLGGGILLGALLYLGFLKIPTGKLFQVTGWFILLLAAGMAASAVGYLSQAGLVPSQAPVWNSSNLLSQHSMVGQLLHIMVGYQDRPTALQLSVYLLTLTFISLGMRSVSKQQAKTI